MYVHVLGKLREQNSKVSKNLETGFEIFERSVVFWRFTLRILSLIQFCPRPTRDDNLSVICQEDQDTFLLPVLSRNLVYSGPARWTEVFPASVISTKRIIIGCTSTNMYLELFFQMSCEVQDHKYHVHVQLRSFSWRHASHSSWSSHCKTPHEKVIHQHRSHKNACSIELAREGVEVGPVAAGKLCPQRHNKREQLHFKLTLTTF